MAKKRKKKKPTHISITIELPEEEEYVSQADIFLYTFFNTLSYWVAGFLLLALIGSCAALL